MKTSFWTANQAFEYFYDRINEHGIDYGNGTKALLNVGFYIESPQHRGITSRPNWSIKYAEREWNWYESGNPSVAEIKQHAPMWDKMHSGDNIVNSNYGYQWARNNQLNKVIEQLYKEQVTRQAWITIFDGKEKDLYEFDTPCTLNIGFKLIDNYVCMTVLMRSNDLWFGFCNDQYCFSTLQEVVTNRLNHISDRQYEIGWYYHFANDLHLYNKHLKR